MEPKVIDSDSNPNWSQRLNKTTHEAYFYPQLYDIDKVKLLDDLVSTHDIVWAENDWEGVNQFIIHDTHSLSIFFLSCCCQHHLNYSFMWLTGQYLQGS